MYGIHCKNKMFCAVIIVALSIEGQIEQGVFGFVNNGLHVKHHYSHKDLTNTDLHDKEIILFNFRNNSQRLSKFLPKRMHLILVS